MNIFTRSMLRAAAAMLLAMTTAMVHAQQAATPPTTTRLLTTVSRVKPDMVEQWLALQKNEVVPALKKAGVKEYDVYQTLLGETAEFITSRPLEGMAEFDGNDPLDRALGVQAAEALRVKLGKCLLSGHQSIETRQDEFFIDPGDAPALFASRYRAAPGRGQDYMNFVRTEMFPVMLQARANGTFAGLTVTVSAHGGESGLITLNMFYPEFAPLDGSPPIAKTLGPEGTRAFIAKGAGLINGLEWIVRRRVADISF